jgi:hypothetical protein
MVWHFLQDTVAKLDRVLTSPHKRVLSSFISAL